MDYSLNISQISLDDEQAIVLENQRLRKLLEEQNKKLLQQEKLSQELQKAIRELSSRLQNSFSEKSYFYESDETKSFESSSKYERIYHRRKVKQKDQNRKKSKLEEFIKKEKLRLENAFMSLEQRKKELSFYAKHTETREQYKVFSIMKQQMREQKHQLDSEWKQLLKLEK